MKGALTSSQVAEILQLGKSTIQKHAKTGYMPSFQNSRRSAVRPASASQVAARSSGLIPPLVRIHAITTGTALGRITASTDDLRAIPGWLCFGSSSA
jgi:hypothetical protein